MLAALDVRGPREAIVLFKDGLFVEVVVVPSAPVTLDVHHDPRVELNHIAFPQVEASDALPDHEPAVNYPRLKPGA